MDVELKMIPVGEVVKNYADEGSDGVTAYDGRLNVRPPYQREFVYKDAQRDLVIKTLMAGFPLNVMYWSVRGPGEYELIDGQQRTVSIAQYVGCDFSHDGRYFDNLPADVRSRILDYPLMIYLCEGTESERLAWFKTINIAGEKLTDQELRNATFAGTWVTDAKRYFSKNGCPAYSKGSSYMTGTPIRQEYLETAIKWASGGDIEGHMGRHMHHRDAKALWRRYEDIMDWVSVVFPMPRPFMKGVDWGPLYDEFNAAALDVDDIEAEITSLEVDDDVRRASGICPYILTRDARHLNLRPFSYKQKRKAYTKQGGECLRCGKEGLAFADMEGDHITPWTEGGRTVDDNCQMLCRDCNRRKGAK